MKMLHGLIDDVFIGTRLVLEGKSYALPPDPTLAAPGTNWLVAASSFGFRVTLEVDDSDTVRSASVEDGGWIISFTLPDGMPTFSEPKSGPSAGTSRYSE
jgi:hypothetical protein